MKTIISLWNMFLARYARMHRRSYDSASQSERDKYTYSARKNTEHLLANLHPESDTVPRRICSYKRQLSGVCRVVIWRSRTGRRNRSRRMPWKCTDDSSTLKHGGFNGLVWFSEPVWPSINAFDSSAGGLWFNSASAYLAFSSNAAVPEHGGQTTGNTFRVSL